MASKAVLTKGIKLQIGDGVTPTEGFTTVSEITSISGPSETAGQIDCTSFDSTAKEYKPALRDGGAVSFDFILDPASSSQAALRADFASGVVRNFKIDLNDATATLTKASFFSFAAIVTGLDTKMGTDDKVTATGTLKVSGAVTFTKAAA